MITGSITGVLLKQGPLLVCDDMGTSAVNLASRLDHPRGRT